MKAEIKIFEFLRVMKRILFDKNYDFYKSHLDVPYDGIIDANVFKENYTNQNYSYPLLINCGRNGGLFRVSQNVDILDRDVRVTKNSVDFIITYSPYAKTKSTVQSLSNNSFGVIYYT